MKIIEKTSNKLVLEEAGSTNLSILCLVVGFILLISCIPLATFYFEDRTENTLVPLILALGSGMGFLGGGYWLFFYAQVETYIFTKNLKCLTLKRQSRVETEVIEYPFGEILKIKLRENRIETSNHGNSINYVAKLVLISGKEISLEDDESLKDLKKKVSQVLEYINVPVDNNLLSK